MESERERRKRQLTLDSLSSAQQKQTTRRLKSLLRARDEGVLSADDESFLASHAEEVAAIEASHQRQEEQRQKRLARAEEKQDSPNELAAKVSALSSLIREVSPAHGGRGVVVHSGAGLSTSAGIPDFRGPSGMWTLQEKGQTPPSVPRYESVLPTLGHSVIAAMVEAGLVRHVVTQNVDGLHTKSGVPRSRVSELHGSVFREKCLSCGAVYERDFDVTAAKGSSFRKHKTGRYCDRAVSGGERAAGGGCREEMKMPQGLPAAGDENVESKQSSETLHASRASGGGSSEKLDCQIPLARHQEEEDDKNEDSTNPKPNGDASLPPLRVCGGELADCIVHFGERLDPAALATATAESQQADVALCLGSSFKVPPANKLPRLARRVVLVNLQWTPLSKAAALSIRGRLDEVLGMVASQLGLKVEVEWPIVRIGGCEKVEADEGSTLFQKQARRKGKRRSRPSFPKAQ